MPFRVAPLEDIEVASWVITVGAPALIVKTWVTEGAGALEPSPAWLAVIEQEPGATMTILSPLTVQTDGVFETNVTVKPELDVAPDANGVTDITLVPGLLKVIVCAVRELTGNTCVTGAAAP